MTATHMKEARASEPQQQLEMSGGRLLAEMLRLHGAGPIFGMGGFQLLPFYGAIGECGLEHHLVNDERAGAFAADAYARVTGRVGLCDATLGPGATNLVTGLVESLNAGIPLIALVGDAERSNSGKHMTQETDQVTILRAAAKHVLRVEAVERIPELVRRAYVIATSGRPGPVVLDIPEDVAHALVAIDQAELWADPAVQSVPARRARPSADDVLGAARLLSRAERPVILCGGGVHLAGGYAPLRELAETLQIPVAHTMSGKGSLPCTHALSVGVFGRYSRIANDLIERADVLFAVGTKLGEIATRRFDLIPRSASLIRLEVDAEDLGRTARVDVGLVGDARLGLEDLNAACADVRGIDRAGYIASVRALKRKWEADVASRLTTSERPINVARLVHELNGALPEEAILVADGGFASHWTGLLYDTKRAGRGYIADRGFASIGYGVPGAIGAALAAPEDAPVVGITGDGGFNMTLGELETAIRIGRHLVVVVVNNAASGYVKALQHVMLKGRYQSSDLSEINYDRIARSMGAHGIRVEAPDALSDALREALSADLPTVVDVAVTRDPAGMLPGVDNRLEKALNDNSGRII